MVGKNNKFLKENKNNQRFLRFSLRKLSVGVVSVAIAAGFYIGGSQSVLADTPSTVPVVRQSTSNDNLAENTDKNTVNLQNSSASADPSAVASAADSTAAEAVKSAEPVASSATEQEKTTTLNVTEAKPIAASKVASLLYNKAQSNATSDAAKAEEDQLADKLLKNIKLSDPTDSNFARYQGYVDKYNNQTTDTSSQYVFSVIRDVQTEDDYGYYDGYDFIWTIDRDTGSKVFVYLAKYGLGYEEIKDYMQLPSNGGNFHFSSDEDVTLTYTPKTDSESGSINVFDKGKYLKAIYGLGTTINSFASSIAELLPEKGQPIIKFLYEDGGKLVNLRKPIYCKEGLTGRKFVLDISKSVNDVSDYTKQDKAFDGFTLVPKKNDGKTFRGTFAQFDQGKNYAKHYENDGSEVIYHQIDANGTMNIAYSKNGKQCTLVTDEDGERYLTDENGELYLTDQDGNLDRLIKKDGKLRTFYDGKRKLYLTDITDKKGRVSRYFISKDGELELYDDYWRFPPVEEDSEPQALKKYSLKAGHSVEMGYLTIRNPFVAGEYAYEFIYVRNSDLKRAITRTINVHTPDGKVNTIHQTATISRDVTVDDEGEVTYSAWSKDATAWVAYTAPKVPGYTPDIAVGAATVDENTKDTTVDITYTANDQSMNINYVDDQGNVIANFSVSGKTDQTVDTKAKIPAGWVLKDGQTDAPKKITFTGAHTDDITIKIEHGKTSVDHNSPVKPGEKTPSGKEIKGAHDEDLNQTITRTIKITEPGKATKTTTQVAHIYRNATVDDVTGDVTYGAWSTDAADWVAVDVPVHAGYTASQADVPAVTVKDGQQDQTVDITYTANDQSMNINYVDDQGNVIANFSVSGKTDQTVDTKAKIPAGWVLKDGQTDAPKKITFTGAHTDDITIKIEHGKTSVDHNSPVKPGEKTPSGKEIKGAHDEDLNQTITRTIKITEPGKATKTTTQVAHIYRNATVDDVTGDVTYGAWSTDAADWVAVDVPVHAGYTASQADVPAVTVKDGQQDQTVDITYTANDQSMNINYVDDQGNVIANFSVSGKTDQTVDTKAKIPAGWVLKDGQTDAPKKITFTGAHTDDITIKIEHGKTSVDHNSPVKPGEKTPSGKEIKGAHDEDLNQTITRTIKITEPGKATKTTTQVAHIYRNATVDDVTGDVTYGAWSTDAADWVAVDVPVHAGYTASQADVPAVTVKDGQQDQTVDITYTANDQSMNINYVDDQGNVIANFSVSGKTDQTVDTKAKIPAGWVLKDGQTDAPKKITFTGAHTDDITIKIEHGKTSVDHNSPVKPGEKTPSGKEIKGAHDEDLNQTITRTIKITEPGKATKTTTQVAHIYRNATVDDVTGDVTYGAWSTDAADWVAVDVPVHAGYTASQADVPAVTVKDGQQDQTVDITYTANDQSMNINYVDDQGNVIANFSVSGKTDQTVDTKAKIPAGWVLKDGQTDAPKKITFTGAHTDDITIKIEHGKTSVDHNSPVKPGEKTPSGKEIKGAHDEDLNQTITRTIKITEPGKATKTTTQVAHIYRNATVDDVTGDVTYGAWSTDAADWVAVDVPVHAGYTASQADVPAVTVKDGQQDQTVDITYTANDQSMNINYVDDQGNVIANFSVSGKTDQTVDTKAKIPAGWVLKDGQTDAPKKITFTGAHTDDITIKIEHGKTSVDHNSPVKPGEKTPSGKEIKGAHDEDLNQTITRTIKITEPGKATKTTTQVAHIYRNATVDDVTGDVTYGAWSTDAADWVAVDVPVHAGYTASQADVPAVTVKDGQQDQTVDITYTANDQSMNINYVDDQGNVIANFSVSGKTDQTVDTKAKIPAGWVLKDGQTDAPKKITFTGAHTDDITIKIEHGKTSVDHNSPVKPGEKTPSGKEIKGAHDEDLNQTITRTIKITEPGKATKTTTQVAHIYRNATVDDVTGDVTYGAWSTDAADWVAVDVPVHAGYTASQADVPAVTVKDGQQDQTVDITYTANDQSMNINYVDDQGNVIANFSVSGKTDQTVDTKAKIPAGWVLKDGQTDAPKKITFTGAHTDDITIKIEHGKTSVDHNSPVKPGEKTPSGKEIKGAHDEDLNQTITRTIKITEPGKATKTTTQVAHIYRNATVDDVTGDVTYGAWSTDAADWVAVDVPVHAGYTASQADVPAVTVKDGQQDQTVDITYTANDQSMNINYVDDQGNVIANFSVSGKTDQTVDTKAKIPAGWVLKDGQTDAPKKITFTGAHTDDITIKIEHGKTSVDHNSPVKPGEKTPSGKEIKGAHDEDLNQTITRTIKITEPGKATKTTTQVAHIYRNATVDDVTGDVTYGAWSTDAADWVAVDVPVHAGYTASQADVPAVTVKDGQQDQTVDITYTANDQSMNINYVDDQGNVIANFSVSGKTDQTVDTKAKIPAGWVLKDGQTDAPKKITFTGAHTDDITIKIEHGKTSVDHNSPVKPGEKTPSGKEIKGAHDEDLNQTITRTIKITEPGKATKTTTQVAHIYRNATVDDVTGDVTYGAWSTDAADWVAVDVPVHAGYTASQADVPAVTVKDGQQDQTVDITYTANDQSMNINYVDDQGNVIANFSVSGKTDQTVDTKAKIPAGWVLKDGQTDAPKKITFTGAHTDDITIKIEHGKTSVDHNSPVKPGEKTPSGKEIKGAHDEDLNQTITRTIKITEPGKATKTTTQVAHIYRNATVDDVTGDVTYGAWSTDAADWVAVDVPVHAGYTASQADVPAVTVKDGQQDVNIDVTYTPDEQKGQITYVDEKRNQISSTPLTGKTDENIAINPVAPAGWELVPGQKYPATVTATADGIPGVTLTVRHHMINVVPGDVPTPGDKKPGNNDKKPGDGTPNKDITHEDLNKTITRTFIVKAPTGTMTKTQHISCQRTATIDDVTGDVTFSDWNTDGASFKAEVIPAISGYTSHVTEGNYGAYAPSQDQINNWTDPMITVTYTANDQSQVINYVDDHNKTIKTDTVHGKTDETVNVTPSVPDHYELVPGQNIPSEVTLKDKNTPIIVKVQPKVDSITDPAKLNKSISRTITINKPGEKPQVINQHADFTRTGQYNEVTGATVYIDWTLKDSTLEAVDAPAVPGYTPNVAHVDSVENPTADTKLANVVINYSADDQTQKIDYVDPNGKVVKTDTVKGKTDETVNVTPSVPDRYELVPGQNIPSEVTLKDKNTPIIVKVQPKVDSITDPAKLNKSISRTITINKPGEKPQVINQTATFKRTGKTNEVTGITTYTPWVLDQNDLTTVSAPEVPGYTPSQKTVASVDNPTANTKLTDVTINYTANSQTTHINYVDKDGETVKSDTVSGKTDQNVKTNSEVPAGWKIIDGQVPETIHFTGEGTPDTTITIEHGTTSVDHTKPIKSGDKTPSGKGIKGAHESDLNQTITRTINVTTPDGQTTTTKQVAKIYRDATIDDVTGEVTYGDWSEGTWADFKPGQVAGYTASLADVPAVTVKDGQKDQTVDITYTANEGTVLIKYVDRDGNEIGRQVITGHIGDTIKVTPQFPENWVPVDPDTVPAEVQIKEENGQIIIVVVRHAEKDPVQTKKVTRTITVTTPDGQTKTIKQVVTISRYGDLDLVTGQIAWQPWTTAQWDVFKPAAIAGYTPSLAEVPAVTVDGETTDQTVDITYAAVTTPAQPEHQAPTASDTTDAQQATNQKADSNAQPAVTVVTSQQTATAQQAESTTNSRRLPQTGNSHDASALAGLGLASLMGLFGLGGKRRKHD